MKNFALIGAAGFVAPRHMKAIHETGNNMLVAVDPHDSVGILDRYFPGCSFFTEIERFDRHLEKLKRSGNKVDYVSVCSPNYLHDAHCRLAMRVGADVICEKPLVLNPWNLDQLEDIEKETGKKVNVVLQIRLHPNIIKIKNEIENKKYKVDIKYITPRGLWYFSSWKGVVAKSGGLITNIGIHLLDLITWLFGKKINFNIIENSLNKIKGEIELENADVDFFLSTDKNDLPSKDISSFRSILINGELVELDNLFTDLHTVVYKNILEGGGFGINDIRCATELAYSLRTGR
jgi:UDP-N-acetyl-2-amino-2-deoxyglucuronate dehydrogenase